VPKLKFICEIIINILIDEFIPVIRESLNKITKKIILTITIAIIIVAIATLIKKNVLLHLKRIFHERS
jgi:hypothetical protein